MPYAARAHPATPMPRDPLRPPKRRSFARRVLHTVLITLIVAFGIGFLIGTLLRRNLDEPVRYYSDTLPADVVIAAGDVVLVDGNPVGVRRVLADAANVRTVILAGEVVCER